MKNKLSWITAQEIIKEVKSKVRDIATLPPDVAIEVLNEIRTALHQVSPMKNEPVDCVLWVKSEAVIANDYNPNSVAPPEMKLLEHSIAQDGFTQPVVTWVDGETGNREVIDGFHRNRVGKDSKAVRERLMGYLPVTTANQWRVDRSDRIAATIRHNRARGKHRVDAMSDIVVELKRRNWSDERICRELGMDQDEVLRLCQVSGLSELFCNQEFSEAWDVAGKIDESDFTDLSDDIETYEGVEGIRTVNTSDPDRIFHHHEKWECFKAGFYDTVKSGMTKQQCEEAYREFLADIPAFRKALAGVISTWKHSCEHYLTNVAMNRIAWLGQASACYAKGIPAIYRAGFHLLTQKQQDAADETALEYLNKWLTRNGRKTVTMEEATSERQSDIY